LVRKEYWLVVVWSRIHPVRPCMIQKNTKTPKQKDVR
jgi:hypothetical protein